MGPVARELRESGRRDLASVAVEVPPRARTSPTISDRDTYIWPAGKELTSTGTLVGDGTIPLYRASKYNCDTGELESRCYPRIPARALPTRRPPLTQQFSSNYNRHGAC
jgi:hypothetical protein